MSWDSGAIRLPFEIHASFPKSENHSQHIGVDRPETTYSLLSSQQSFLVVNVPLPKWSERLSARERMKGFSELVTVSEFLHRLFDALPIAKRLETEDCKLPEALGRVLAESISSPFNLPRFDRSAVDGYALRAFSTIGASPTNPIEFRVVATIAAGNKPDELMKIGDQEASLVFTGAPLPEGADSVVMVEHCGRTNGSILVRRQVHPAQNVSRRGEDYSKDETIVAAGTVLKPWHIGAIASVGRDHVEVQRFPRVGVLSTGSEVVEPGQPISPGQVANCTKPMLLSFIRQEGCKPIDLGTVADDLGAIARSIAKGLEHCDMILTTGGSSVGEKDLVQQAVSQLHGYKFVVHGVRLRPGRPTGVSMVGEKPVFILSGFPVAAMAAFQAIVKPTVRRLTGADEEPTPIVKGILKRRVSNEAGNRSYVRVRVIRKPKELEVEPLMLTGSGLLSTLTKANALLVVNEEVEGYDEGEEVEVLLTGNPIPA